MNDYIEIHWTAGSIDEARKVCRYLVQERLVACAQIVPWVESVFLWNHQLETSQESKVIFKTKKNNYQSIKEVIFDNCTYELPEITYVNIDGGNEEYLSWIEENVSN